MSAVVTIVTQYVMGAVKDPAQLKANVMVLVDQLDSKLADNATMVKLSRATGVRRAYLAIAAFVLVCSGLFGRFGFDPIALLIGYVYPAYASFKAISTPERDDDKQWLTYWVVHSLFVVLENLAGFLLAVIPFYYFLKLAFLVWCFYPSTRGAEVVFNVVIAPFLIRHQDQIERTLRRNLPLVHDLLVDEVTPAEQKATAQEWDQIFKNTKKISGTGHTVTVVVQKGSKLRAADDGGTSDVFCVFFWQSMEKREDGKRATRVVHKTTDPDFGEKLRLPWDAAKSNLVVEAYDWDSDTVADFLGRVNVAFQDLTFFASEYKLTSNKEKNEPDAQGTLTFGVSKYKLGVKLLQGRAIGENAQAEPSVKIYWRGDEYNAVTSKHGFGAPNPTWNETLLVDLPQPNPESILCFEVSVLGSNCAPEFEGYSQLSMKKFKPEKITLTLGPKPADVGKVDSSEYSGLLEIALERFELE